MRSVNTGGTDAPDIRQLGLETKATAAEAA
jgi:hypothetical protein